MKDYSSYMKSEYSQETIRRRGLLAAVAAAGAGGLAGCGSVDVNVGDDGTDGGDDRTNGGVSGDLSCTDITNGYEQQDVGERPIIFDFEYPAMFDELLYTQAGTGAFYRAERATGEDGSVEIMVNQVTEPEGSADDGSGGASGTTTTFNGEEVEFTGLSSGSGLLWAGNLPYQFQGERRMFPTTLTLSADEESNECGDALREAAEHIVDSMEVNPETTIEN